MADLDCELKPNPRSLDVIVLDLYLFRTEQRLAKDDKDALEERRWREKAEAQETRLRQITLQFGQLFKGQRFLAGEAYSVEVATKPPHEIQIVVNPNDAA
jgi:hypothetical protein